MTTTPKLRRCFQSVQGRLWALRDRVSEDRGALMAEYGILIFFVGIAGFGILALFGQEVWELFSTTESEFDSSRQIPPAAD